MEAIKTEFPYIFTETRFFSAPQLTIHEIDDQAFSIGPTEILPIRVLHNKLPVFGYRIGGLTYITDASMIPDEEKHKIYKSKVLVLNALRNSKHISHLSLSEALQLIEELKPERAYLTHISHFLGLHAEVEKKLPGHIRLAYDNLIVEIS